MAEDLKQNLINLIESAVSLANSVQEDLKDTGIISEITTVLLTDFKRRHDELDTVLDIVNGLQ
jgi:hypothetical protein